MAKTAVSTTSEFQTRFRGYFISLLSWDQLASFWTVLRAHADAGWYVYAIGEPVPEHPSSGDAVRRFIDAIDSLLHSDHDEDYCGIVYADSREQPTFVKIFDPNNLGVSCGSSKNPPLPGWILCTIAPEEMKTDRILPERRRRWWTALWA